MTQAVTLIYPDPASPGGFASWNLKVTSIDDATNRQASVFPLPVFSNNQDVFLNRPVVWALDLGMLSETTVLHGICNDLESDPSVPTYTQLREIVRCASSYKQSVIQNGSLTFLNPVTIGVFTGNGQAGSGKAAPFNRPGTSATESRVGVIMSFAGHRDEGQVKWEWTLTHASIDFSQAAFYH